MTNDTELPDNILTSPSTSAYPLSTTAASAILGLEKVIVSQGWEVR